MVQDDHTQVSNTLSQSLSTLELIVDRILRLEVGISEKILASNKSTTLIPINDELVYSNEDQMDNTDAELELALQLSLSTYQRESTGQTNETVVSISHTETQYKQHGENTIVSEEWECPTCTLMNTAENASDCCLACGLPRYS